MEPSRPLKKAQIDVGLSTESYRRFRVITLDVAKELLEELSKTYPDRKSFTWRNVTLPMATHAKDRVRADLAQEGITVDESKIVERLKKALVGQQRSGKKPLVETAASSAATGSDPDRPYDPIRDIA